MNEDRRKHPRFSLNQCIQISYGKENFIEAEAINISQNGLLCNSSVPIDNLDRIYMLIDLSFENDVKTIECEGILMYAKSVSGKNQFGVQFIEMDAENSYTLKQYLAVNN